jgi:pimeloyl-ACP methyl ester carboxylesterase
VDSSAVSQFHIAAPTRLDFCTNALSTRRASSKNDADSHQFFDAQTALPDFASSRAGPDRSHCSFQPASRTALLKHALAGVFHDARRDLHRIEAPTVVLAGQHDAVLGVKPSRALSESITDATFELIAESGHDLTLEQPLVAAARVHQFFMS